MAGKESEKIKQHIYEKYIDMTKKSKENNERAKRLLPGGDTRTATYFFPHPLYMAEGKGCYLYDCDGNEYIDFLNNYTSLIHGHAHPRIIEAAQAQLAKGTVLGAPAEVPCFRLDLSENGLKQRVDERRRRFGGVFDDQRASADVLFLPDHVKVDCGNHLGNSFLVLSEVCI